MSRRAACRLYAFQKLIRSSRSAGSDCKPDEGGGYGKRGWGEASGGVFVGGGGGEANGGVCVGGFGKRGLGRGQ
jgi:hypothetical protein